MILLFCLVVVTCSFSLGWMFCRELWRKEVEAERRVNAKLVGEVVALRFQLQRAGIYLDASSTPSDPADFWKEP
jgi:hypothetical protein